MGKGELRREGEMEMEIVKSWEIGGRGRRERG